MTQNLQTLQQAAEERILLEYTVILGVLEREQIDYLSRSRDRRGVTWPGLTSDANLVPFRACDLHGKLRRLN